MDLSALGRVWVTGWARSRGVPPAVEDRFGLRLAVGAPEQRVRHVLPVTDEASVRALAGSIEEPAIWIKAFLDPELIGSWLPTGWVRDIPGWMMTTRLRPARATAPDGFGWSSATDDGVTRVRLLADDGTLAAAGQCVVTGPHVVMDRIQTQPAYRRRGLGRLVMGALGDAALDRGAHTGVLSATVEGRALYRTLDWAEVAPLAGFVHRPPRAG
ncbi:GNAT family N-acetyltransferase [Streptomyces sp. NBRC 109706]|uniref:GNAT family N-acetyltransferase n=1 Tax=Streptomyces sp. NBRC 109706 TaxID=1550035 RepID=UPI000784DD31|nr:GNAT family N-acetyltransferase [Streptomyces sp. NBRC 109706]